jgi:NitT/TauT family transport system substrate-binding protein
MHTQHARQCSRRAFLSGLTWAGTAGFLGLHATRAAAEPPPETTRLRLVQNAALCSAPQFAAEELLRLEGFTDVQYVTAAKGLYLALAAGEIDINPGLGGQFILRIDAGDPLVILSGTHAGCFELFATERIRTVKDLKGKTVVVPGMGTSHHLVVASMAAYVGLDPRSDITFVTPATDEAIRLLAAGEIDAMMGFPPEPQELRAKQIGHVVFNMTMDRPWSQYFCCMLAGNREFVGAHPIATKRVLRAVLKAADLCAAEPERAARQLVDGGVTPRLDFALQTMTEVAYDRWREYDAEDTIRFYALQLREAGMITANPKQIIADGTDWRFLNELKRELKA